MIILLKNEKLALKFELMIHLSKMKKNWSQNLTSLKCWFFSNFHTVQSIALQCKSICTVYFFFKNGAKCTMCNQLHSKRNRLHQWKKWSFVNFLLQNRDFRRIIPGIFICQMLRLGTYKTQICKDKDKYFFVFWLEVSQQHIYKIHN